MRTTTVALRWSRPFLHFGLRLQRYDDLLPIAHETGTLLDASEFSHALAVREDESWHAIDRRGEVFAVRNEVDMRRRLLRLGVGGVDRDENADA
jgi:hypothetical protein